jgi:hypothetical protein
MEVCFAEIARLGLNTVLFFAALSTLWMVIAWPVLPDRRALAAASQHHDCLAH